MNIPSLNTSLWANQFMEDSKAIVIKYIMFFSMGFFVKHVSPFPPMETSIPAALTLYFSLLIILSIYYYGTISNNLLAFTLGFLVYMFIVINSIDTISVFCAIIFTAFTTSILCRTLLYFNDLTIITDTLILVGLFIAMNAINWCLDNLTPYTGILSAIITCCNFMLFRDKYHFIKQISNLSDKTGFVSTYGNGYGMNVSVVNTIMFMLYMKLF